MTFFHICSYVYNLLSYDIFLYLFVCVQLTEHPTIRIRHVYDFLFSNGYLHLSQHPLLSLYLQANHLKLEDWEYEFEWLRIRHEIKDQFGKPTLPDLNAMLFLIGMRELGQMKEEWTKEEKQDLMHIATCELLAQEGYYQWKGLDQDGWPHYEKVKRIQTIGVNEQERMLKELVIRYFKKSYFEEE